MNQLEELQYELEQWINKYEEAEADIDEAENRRDEAEKECNRIEKQIENLKIKIFLDTQKSIRAKISQELSFDTSLLKAYLFTTNGLQFIQTNCIYVTDKEVIGTDKCRAYVAEVKIPDEMKNTMITFSNAEDAIQARQPSKEVLTEKKFITQIQEIIAKAKTGSKITDTKALLESKLTKYSDIVYNLEKPFNKTAFSKYFMDDALAVMHDGEWVFEQENPISPFIISDNQETILIMPVRRKD